MKESELYSEKAINQQDALEHGLSEEEYKRILAFLGRPPTVTELGIYSGLWSEHCSYKNSIELLKTLPTDSPRALARAGEENAGALDIGNNRAVVFKIESHNHPSAIEPYQGAATGVGGIMRDIFTMGARPICSLNSLRFGPPTDQKNQRLLAGAVKGIGDYGNSLGVAVSGGELFFHPSFSRNCLVNAMTVGIVEHQGIARAKAEGVGNPVIYIGATTGRDGIHGASFASRDLSQESESKRSAVQVGDPFMEKLLLEATLELIATGALVGIQDMGAAGLSCASSEMSAKGHCGMDINLDLVPLREEGMNAYEIMLSESQERMLAVVTKGREKEVETILKKWGLAAVVIGQVTDDGLLRVRRNGKLCAEIPARSLVLGGGAPRYRRETRKPRHIDDARAYDLDALPPMDLPSTFLELTSGLNTGSRRPLYDQYDTEVGLVRVVGPGGDGGVARVPGTNIGIAVSTDCNSRYVYLDPRAGTAQAVFESARNVAVTGAEPLGITNCLNFGNPYIPENYYMFSESIGGMRDACLALGVPVTGGNVSFYNESEEGPVLPTPTIGMVGLIEDIQNVISPYFTKPGLALYLVGRFYPAFGGSEVLWLKHNIVSGAIPPLDEGAENRLVRFFREASKERTLASARDLSLGGLALALFRSAARPELNAQSDGAALGFRVRPEFVTSMTGVWKRPDLVFFGETNGCALVALEPSKVAQMQEIGARSGIELRHIGETTEGDFDFGTFLVDGAAARKGFESALEAYF